MRLIHHKVTDVTLVWDMFSFRQLWKCMILKRALESSHLVRGMIKQFQLYYDYDFICYADKRPNTLT